MDGSRTPRNCPSCGGALHVTSLACSRCETAVTGNYALPLLARLDEDEQQFVVRFIIASGSLKELARRYNVSYPTIRNQLDALIEEVRRLEANNASKEK